MTREEAITWLENRAKQIPLPGALEVYRMAIAALRELDAQEKQESFGEWISVKDKMPEPFVSVLGYMPDAAPFPEVRECYCTGDSDKKFFVPALSERHEISHWAELPEPPKENEA